METFIQLLLNKIDNDHHGVQNKSRLHNGIIFRRFIENSIPWIDQFLLISIVFRSGSTVAEGRSF